MKKKRSSKMKAGCLMIGMVVLFATGLLTNSSYADIGIEDAIGIWLFDEGSGDIAKDSSGNGNDGQIMNAPEWVDGKSGKALRFDGVDDYINLPAATSDNWEGMTVAAWVWLNLLPNELPYSYGEIYGSNQDLYDLYEDRGNNELRCKFATTSSAERPGIPTAQLVTGQWLHIAGTYDNAAGEAKIYMNGELQDTHNLTGIISGVQYSSIGAQGGPNGPFTDFLDGILDEVAIFNVALTEQEIQTIMEQGVAKSVGITAVDLSGKLTTTWADIKAR
jgi:hypothetical protein